jgi:hypothetical protein
MSDEFDPHDRDLCSDGTCIGLIGPDGRCKECGKPGATATVDPRNRGLRSEEEVAEELEANITKGDIAEAPDDFDDRQLCSDGTCVGLIGRDGRCKECGQPAG